MAYTLSQALHSSFYNLRLRTQTMVKSDIDNLLNQENSILLVWFQNTSIKRIRQQRESHDFFWFPLAYKFMFTLYRSLLNVQ